MTEGIQSSHGKMKKLLLIFLYLVCCIAVTDAQPKPIKEYYDKDFKRVPSDKASYYRMVMRWLAQRLIASVYVELNKPSFPFRVFTDEEKAVKWLLKHKK